MARRRRLLLPLPSGLRALLLLLLLLLLLSPAAASAASASADIQTQQTQTPPPPRFAVAPPPLSRALFPALEAARLQGLKLLGGGRGLYINTSQRTHVHVLVFKSPGQQREAADPLPPIGLLHGVCSTAHDYAPLVRRLRRRCRSIIVLDLPGHGRSPLPPGNPDLDTLVSLAVEAVRRALELAESDDEGGGSGRRAGESKAVLFGNSLGGLVGCRVALAMPERVAGLCLASPAGAPMTPADLAEVQALFQLDSHATGLAFLHRVTAFPDRLPLLLPHLMAWCCRARASTGPIAHIMSRAQARHMLTRRELRRLKVPTLLIWGRHERVFSERLRSFFVKHLPRRGSVPRTEEDFCRVPFLDDPDRLVELLEEFVRKYCVSELIIG